MQIFVLPIGHFRFSPNLLHTARNAGEIQQRTLLSINVQRVFPIVSISAHSHNLWDMRTFSQIQTLEHIQSVLFVGIDIRYVTY